MINQRIDYYIGNKISNAKQRFKEYFSLEKSIGHLMKVAKDFYLISIGINEINDGIKIQSDLK